LGEEAKKSVKRKVQIDKIKDKSKKIKVKKEKRGERLVKQDFSSCFSCTQGYDIFIHKLPHLSDPSGNELNIKLAVGNGQLAKSSMVVHSSGFIVTVATTIPES